jgi:hypothetical protein
LTIPGSDRPDATSSVRHEGDDRPIVRARGALWRRGDFGVVVLGAGRPDPLTLAGTGVAIWDALDRPCRRRDLIERLAAGFGADPALVAADVTPVVEDLIGGGVVEVVT